MKKIPLVSIGVMRNGNSITPEIGKPFDFNDEELKDLAKLSRETKVDYVRDPVNEGGEGSVDTTHAKTVAVVSALLADENNLTGQGSLKMDVLTAALNAAGLPKMSAAERDAIVAEISEANEI